MINKYTMVSGLVFGVIAVGQAMRALNQWPVQVADFSVPVWPSWLAAIVAGSLCLWAIRTARR